MWLYFKRVNGLIFLSSRSKEALGGGTFGVGKIRTFLD